MAGDLCARDGAVRVDADNNGQGAAKAGGQNLHAVAYGLAVLLHLINILDGRGVLVRGRNLGGLRLYRLGLRDQLCHGGCAGGFVVLLNLRGSDLVDKAKQQGSDKGDEEQNHDQHAHGFLFCFIHDYLPSFFAA